MCQTLLTLATSIVAARRCSLRLGAHWLERKFCAHVEAVAQSACMAEGESIVASARSHLVLLFMGRSWPSRAAIGTSASASSIQ